jgi:osmotically inducible protein OsmC
MPQRFATAIWKGSLKEGEGQLTTNSGALSSLPYSFRMRFEDAPGTNPEELIAAAHAGCFSMALSAALGEQGKTPTSIETKATVTLEPVDGKPTVTRSHLEVVASVPDMDETSFNQVAEGAKANCPISRLLNCEITMSTTFAG